MKTMFLTVLLFSLAACSSAPKKDEAGSGSSRRPQAASRCDLLNQSSSTQAVPPSDMKVVLNFYASFESEFDAKTCVPDLDYVADSACEGMREYRVNKRFVDVVVTNAAPGWEKVKITLQGECKESDRAALVSGQFIKPLKFHKTSDWTSTRSLE